MQRLHLSSDFGRIVVATTRQLILNHAFIQAHRMNEKCFSRQRQLTFARLCVLIVQKTVRSLHAHLTDFFGQLTEEIRDSVGVSAFTQARAKLKHTVFIELNQKAILANVYAPANGPALARWRAWRLIAIDSSLVRLPSNQELGEHFGWVECRNQSGPTRPCVQARLSVAYDLLNQIGLETIVCAPTRGERQIALEHLGQLQPEDLAVLDRGFAGYELFARFLQAGRQFVCRCERNTFQAAQELFRQNQGGVSKLAHLSKPASVQAADLPQTIPVRLVTVALPNGQLEVLITSLTNEAHYSIDELAQVYRARWGIETYYGRLKDRLDLQHFSGRTLQAILQDIHATVYLSNLETVLIGPAQEELSKGASNQQEAPRVNHAVAFHAIKTRMIDLLLSDQPLDELIAEMKECFLRNRQPHRPNRSAPRSSSSWTSYHFQRNVRKPVY